MIGTWEEQQYMQTSAPAEPVRLGRAHAARDTSSAGSKRWLAASAQGGGATEGTIRSLHALKATGQYAMQSTENPGQAKSRRNSLLASLHRVGASPSGSCVKPTHSNVCSSECVQDVCSIADATTEQLTNRDWDAILMFTKHTCKTSESRVPLDPPFPHLTFFGISSCISTFMTIVITTLALPTIGEPALKQSGYNTPSRFWVETCRKSW